MDRATPRNGRPAAIAARPVRAGRKGEASRRLRTTRVRGDTRLHKRRLLRGGALAALLAAAPRAPRAQPAPAAVFPAGPVRLVVPFAAGGPTDVFARVFAVPFGRELGVPVVVDNRAGGGGIVGAQEVIRARPDGQTLIFHASSSAVVGAITRRVRPYDPVADFAPVSLLGVVPSTLAVGAAVPARTLAELVALLRASPGRNSYGSAGVGSLPHLGSERFLAAAGGLKAVHVPYRGSGPAIQDTVAGVVAFTIDTFSTMLSLHREGQLRILAVFAEARSEAAPEVPTAREGGVDLVNGTFNLVSAPARTPPERLARLDAAAQAVMARPEFLAALRAQGIDPTPGYGPERSAGFVAAELERLLPVVRAADIAVD